MLVVLMAVWFVCTVSGESMLTENICTLLFSVEKLVFLTVIYMQNLNSQHVTTQL